MSVDEAVAVILGDQLAASITLDMGPHWAIVAAVAQATDDMDPEAIATIRAHLRKVRP